MTLNFTIINHSGRYMGGSQVRVQKWIAELDLRAEGAV